MHIQNEGMDIVAFHRCYASMYIAVSSLVFLGLVVVVEVVWRGKPLIDEILFGSAARFLEVKSQPS